MAEAIVSSAVNRIGDSLKKISQFLNEVENEASFSISPCTYDVFLSFRGADTRTNFTDHLYTALRQARIHTFRDDDEIERGENINAELQKAIKESNISIIVLSKDYASSRWCLDELVMIMERRRTVGHTVVPVFYDVDPSPVRNQTGSFSEAFARHKMRFKEDKVESWRAALREVADLAGEVLGNRHQTLFIQDIVKMIGKKLYPPVRDQVENVQTGLKNIRCFLNDADSKASKGNESASNCVTQIIDLAYDAEDVIETYAVQVESVKSEEGTINALRKFAGVLWQELEPITAKISKLTSSLQTYSIKDLKDGSSSSGHQRPPSYSHVVEPYFVGRDESIEELVKYLVDNEKNCQIISICGMGGLGKTTLAKKVYHHGKVKRHFDYFAWSCISQQCRPRDVWEGILIKLNEPRDEIKKLRDEELAEKLYQVQQEKRCLVILDDIWSIQAWDSLRDAFPYEETSSKILLTTRNKDVALHADPSGFHYEPRCLTKEESWELLQKIAIPQKDGADLKIDTRIELGKKMVKHCGGLPLAITVLGGVLATKEHSSEWHTMLKTIKSCLKRGKGHGKEQFGVSGVLSLSYDDLPTELKPCFLYLSHFPEDYEIDVNELIRLWVAEGIITSEQHDNEEGVETMEDVAERYLNELVKRFMVLVGKRDGSLRITSCRMHDLMKDLCLSKAEEENFLRIVDCLNGDVNVDSIPSSSSDKIRRLAIYMHESCSESPLKHIKNPHLRSLLSFDTNDNDLLEIPIFNNLKLIRVLHLDHKYTTLELSKDIGKLIHLRYLHLNAYVRELPSSLGMLRCLQTLNLIARLVGPVHIPNILYKMEDLRHLYLPCWCDNKTKLRLGNLRRLQTLVNFSFKNFDIYELLNNMTNLRVLTILDIYLIRDFGDIFKSQGITLQHLRSLHLKIGDSKKIEVYPEPIDVGPFILGCINLYKLAIDGLIKKLPDHLPASITDITLERTKLEEDPMTALEKLPSLTTLTLTFAFIGKQLFCSGEGFPRLHFLCLSDLRNLEEWRVDEGALPNLCHLEIDYCEKLKMLPDGLRFVKTLKEKELVIKKMPKEFKEKWVIIHVPSVTFYGCNNPGPFSQISGR